MKTNTPCPKCGKTNPADVHTCTSKKDIEEWFKKQDQSTDSNPIGYLLWDAGIGWWEFVEEEPVEYYDYKAVYVCSPKPEPARKPMTEEEIIRAFGYDGNGSLNSFGLGAIEGVRYAEKYHGIGGGDD